MKRLKVCVFGTAMVLAASAACTADEPSGDRTPEQQHNRMLYIRTEGKPIVFVDMPKHYDVGSPSISPSGKWIAFDANTIGDAPVRETWLVGVDGHGRRKLVNGATPRWFHDDSKITFTRDREGKSTIHSTSDIYEFDLATGKENRLCLGRFADWSPDGKHIAFARGGEITENGGTHWGSFLYLAKPDGSSKEELGLGDWPSWSPDGRKLAFVMHEESDPPIVWVLDLLTRARQRLGVGFYRPQWTGDSKSVCVLTYALNPDGRGITYRPARIYLAMDRQDFFLMNLDNPWAPSISIDGKTTIAVVDSKKKMKPEDAGEP